jgi:frataxin-like iron-binding protein CyaY
LSAASRAWHFRSEPGGWPERDTGESMHAVLSELFTRKLGVAVVLKP